MDKVYSPKNIEKKIYDSWIDNDCFKARESKSNYSIVLPPPNVTGTLHMGHAFQHTIIDILVRYNRMLGKSVLWQPGTDHAGIATQLVVENNLIKKGKTRHDIGRKKLIEEIWKWKEQSGNTIISQTKRLGSSADWDRNRFTMDEGLSEAVKKVFIELYNQGIIYRGKRLVNWDIKLQTALSDLEVENKEIKSKLYFIKYNINNSSDQLIVATTRPETLFGDTAICINPEDERFRKYIGKTACVPLVNRMIPIIGDESIDKEFGTGCVKITPAHDFNDYKLGIKHNLDFINILNKDGTLNDIVGDEFCNRSIHDSRDDVIKALISINAYLKDEDYSTTVPIGGRSGEIIEPLLTNQWFMKMKDIVVPAIDAVKNSNIKFVPKNWEKIYFNWLDNIEDWCISRQIWWGHRIPAWYDSDDNVYVGYSEEEVREFYKLDGRELIQDEDVLDTWFSSSLWPFASLGWPEKTEDFKRHFPTSLLVTGFDIIFFWVARMMMMSLEFTDQIPFKDVYVTGLIRDENGQKMSKSKGNVIDPLDLIYGISQDDLVKKRTTNLMQEGIAKKIENKTRNQFPKGIDSYGTDALRMTFYSLATHTKDISFEMGRLKGYRNFCTKVWNAARFINGYPAGNDKFQSTNKTDEWIYEEFENSKKQIEKNIKDYRLDYAINEVYEFFWNKFCDVYIEECKKSGETDNLRPLLKEILIMMHPFAPFITEEIHSLLFDSPII